jgi:hypothetical protein
MFDSRKGVLLIIEGYREYSKYPASSAKSKRIMLVAMKRPDQYLDLFASDWPSCCRLPPTPGSVSGVLITSPASSKKNSSKRAKCRLAKRQSNTCRYKAEDLIGNHERKLPRFPLIQPSLKSCLQITRRFALRETLQSLSQINWFD